MTAASLELSWLLFRLGDLGFLSSQRVEDLAWMVVDDLMVKAGASTDFGWWLDDVALLYDRPPQKLVDRVLAAYREALIGFGPVMEVFNTLPAGGARSCQLRPNAFS